MSSRMFQGVVLQMKDSISRTVGVVDAEGIVVACSELTCIGEHWPGAVAAINGAENNLARFEGRTFRSGLQAPGGLGRSIRLRRLCQGGGRVGRVAVRRSRSGL